MSSRAIFGLETQPCSWNWLWRLWCRPQWAQNLDKIVVLFDKAISFSKPCCDSENLQAWWNGKQGYFSNCMNLNKMNKFIFFHDFTRHFLIFQSKNFLTLIVYKNQMQLKKGFDSIAWTTSTTRNSEATVAGPSEGLKVIFVASNKRSFSETGSEYFSDKI